MATQRPSERTLDTELFERVISFEYSATWVGYSLLGLRLVMAWVFLQAGLAKWAEGGWGDPLVVFGQILIGIALLTGTVVRFAAMMGALQMLFFWTAAWQGGLMAGFPVEHGYFVNSSLVYLLTLFGLGAWRTGRVFGLDSRLEQTVFVQQRPWLRYLLG
ncbi:hypothetical protein [Halovenus halobia]|uniref:hypothetical protein n=1 Tax=Halovenus halobia TaxID=3396622 RepID=UPI003F54EDBF